MMTATEARSEARPLYVVPAAEEDAIVARALEILSERVSRGPAMTSPMAVRDYLTVRAAAHDVEVFSIMLLDAQNRLIRTRDMFRGTLTQTSVYPREIVRAALADNAAAVILAHNHPSGVPEPSAADEVLTKTVRAALQLVDVRVLDHIVTAGGASVSFAERGLI